MSKFTDFFMENVDEPIKEKPLGLIEQDEKFWADNAIPIKNEIVKHRYVFPNIMAKWMSKVDQRTQYEASIMGNLLILAGLIWFGVMMTFFSQSTLTFKIMADFNVVAGFILLSSSMVTQYQQYKAYMEAMESMKEIEK